MSKSSYLKRSIPKIIITALILTVLIFIVFVWGNYALYKKLPIKYENFVEKYSAEYEIDKYFVYAIINTESNFNSDAKSHAGAIGLMQILPSTADFLNEKYKLGYEEIVLTDPETNIRLGTCYVAYLSKRFNADNKLILAAYNGGEGNVRSWLKNPEYSVDGETLTKIPFEETSQYVKKVSVRYDFYKKLYS